MNKSTQFYTSNFYRSLSRLHSHRAKVKLFFEVCHSFITANKRSCGKVMFLHLSLSHSFHRGGVHPPWQTLPPHGHWSGRYASYWNALLLIFFRFRSVWIDPYLLCFADILPVARVTLGLSSFWPLSSGSVEVWLTLLKFLCRVNLERKNEIQLEMFKNFIALINDITQ